MFFIDTHFHAGDYIPDMGEYCGEAAAESVSRLILCSGNFEESERAASFASENEAVYFAAGVHPHEAERMTGNFEDFKVFAGFLELALQLDVPALIHCRDKDGCFGAYDISLEMLTEFHRKGGRYLLHCFAGNREYAEKFMEAGAMFGVGGMLTFKMAENIRETISIIPMKRLMLETDAPYLAPVPYRGRPNHSKYIPLIAQKLAWLKGITLEQCAVQTTGNALRFFNLPKGV